MAFINVEAVVKFFVSGTQRSRYGQRENERMTESLSGGHSLFGVFFEKFWDEVFGDLWDG